MTEGEADLLVLLRELDDPEWLEWPQHYDRGEAAVRFSALVARLEKDFAARCTAEGGTQDSSEYGRVVVPGDATVCGTRIVVCVSKFGSLALVCADNPGAFLGTDDARAEGELDSADLARVNRALAELGHVVVPEELLESDYDGPSRLPSHVQRPTWWHRFFGTF
ncbi:hypothetical protein ACWCWD_08140 [Streptomyces sp. NPDC001493]